MYSPEAISRDISSNLMYSTNNNSSSGFKHGFLDGGFLKGKEILGSGSDLFLNQHQPQHQQQQNGSLMRYRSAPSSYFASFLDANNTTNNSNNSNNGDSSESDSIFSTFMNCNEPGGNDLGRRHQNDHRNNQGLQVSGSMKMEMNEVQSNPQMLQNGNGFSGSDNLVQMGYQAAVSAGGGTVVGSYSVPVGVENQVQMAINNNANHSNLIRQSSSPAGFFNGFDVMREVGKFRSSNGDTSSSTSGFNNHMNFSSGPSSSTRYMPSIAEDGSETVRAANQENVQLGNRNENGRGYAPGFSSESWNDSAFSSLKRNRDGDLKIFSDFNGLENQDGEARNYTTSLTHHLSLPKTAGEMAAVEKYLQFQQDSVVPCKIRAKRGCATHPRSIAERMRRTRISDRMKKLQELFPNMDKVVENRVFTEGVAQSAIQYYENTRNFLMAVGEMKLLTFEASDLEKEVHQQKW